jgi:hypothetical protein
MNPSASGSLGETARATLPTMITRFSHLRGAQPPTARVDASLPGKRLSERRDVALVAALLAIKSAGRQIQ